MRAVTRLGCATRFRVHMQAQWQINVRIDGPWPIQAFTSMLAAWTLLASNVKQSGTSRWCPDIHHWHRQVGICWSRLESVNRIRARLRSASSNGSDPLPPWLPLELTFYLLFSSRVSCAPQPARGPRGTGRAGLPRTHCTPPLAPATAGGRRAKSSQIP